MLSSVLWRLSNTFAGSGSLPLLGAAQHEYTTNLYSALLLSALLVSVQSICD